MLIKCVSSVYFRYVQKITVTRDHLRELQKLYHLRAKDKNKGCIADWIHRLAAHLQVDAKPYLEPYEGSSDEDKSTMNDYVAEDDYPGLDDRIYVNMTDPLVLTAEEEEFVHEGEFADED